MFSEEQVEIAIFFLTQSGLAVWLLSDAKTDIKNIKSQVIEMGEKTADTRDRVLRIEGRLKIGHDD